MPLKAKTSLKPEIRTVVKVNAILHLDKKKSVIILRAGFHQEQQMCSSFCSSKSINNQPEQTPL